MKIGQSKLVTVDYKLYVLDDDNNKELMEETTEEQPLVYLHGLGMMLQKFEENLEGLAAGATFEFTLDAVDAYGEYEEESVVDLPINIFAIDGEIDTERVYPGAIVPLMDNEGNKINAEVVSISEEAVTVDFNHPLAGETLIFEGSVREVKQPSEEELQEMMNPSCGCGGCGSKKEGCESEGCGSCCQ